MPDKSKKILSIEIDDYISSNEWWGFSLKQLRRKMKDFSGNKIEIPINSYGGEVGEGTGIYQTLIGFNDTATGKEVTTKVVGYAVSMGSIIFCSGVNREIPNGSWVMVHEPWTYAMGDSDDMKGSHEMLESMANVLASILANTSKRAGKEKYDAEFWRGLMKKETWLTAQDAKKYGLATKITEGVVVNSFKQNPNIYNSLKEQGFKNIPEEIKNLKSTKKTKSKKMAFNWKKLLNPFFKDDEKVDENDTSITDDQVIEKFKNTFTEDVANAVIEKQNGTYASIEDFTTLENNIAENKIATETIAKAVKKLNEAVSKMSGIEQKAQKAEKELEDQKLKQSEMTKNVLERLAMGDLVTDVPGSPADVADTAFSKSKATTLNADDTKKILGEVMGIQS